MRCERSLRRGRVLVFGNVEPRHNVSTIAEDPETSTVADLRQIAHDLRGPLNTMRLSLDLLRRGLDRDDAGGDDFRRSQLKQIERLERQIATMSAVLSRVIDTAPEHDEGGSR